MGISYSDRGKQDAKNGVYDPPPAGSPEWATRVYDAAWDEETQRQRRTDRY